MQTVMDKQHKWLLGRYHAACKRLAMTADEKREALSAFGVESSVDLNNDDLLKLCFNLEKMASPALAEQDAWRKRVFAAIAAYLDFVEKEKSPELIKGICCRSTGYERFNEIPVDRLRNVYYAFVKKRKDFERSFNEMQKMVYEK